MQNKQKTFSWLVTFFVFYVDTNYVAMKELLVLNIQLKLKLNDIDTKFINLNKKFKKSINF